MMLVAGPVRDGLGDLADRAERAGRVELGDVDEGDAGGEADDAGEEEPDPDRQPVGRRRPSSASSGWSTNASPTTDSRVVTQYPRLRMFIGFSVSLPRMKNIATMVARSPKARTTSGKKIQASGFGQPQLGRDLEHRDAQDHGADVLGGGGLEQVRAAAGAVADVVADEVRDDARVAGVVLGDALLDLAHEVGAHVRGLGVDAAAQLGEQGDEAGAEPEADDEERRLLDRDVRRRTPGRA